MATLNITLHGNMSLKSVAAFDERSKSAALMVLIRA